MPARRLALHTWTLDSTPLPDVLRIVTDTGWDAIELRRLDWTRAASGAPAPDVVELVKASGVPVACVGVEVGWMFADGAERARLLAVFAEQCARAAALGCRTVMSPVDRGHGDVAQAVASVREVGDIAAAHDVRLAIEFNSQCQQLNRLEPVREIVARADHPHCGLLLDSYHMQRSGWDARAFEDVRLDEIAYVQYSDVPRSGLEPGVVLNRLPPGRGAVPFKDFFSILAAKGYTGYLSYEAPNTEAWKRDPAEVAREAIEATRGM